MYNAFRAASSKQKVLQSLENLEFIIMGGNTLDNEMNNKFFTCHVNQDDLCGEWKVLTEKPPEMLALWSAYCIVPEGIVVVGGVMNGALTNQCFMFITKSKSWKKLPPIKKAVSCMAAIYMDNSIYVLGGHDRKGATNHVCHLNLDTMKWSCDPPMLVKQYWPLATTIGSGIYIAFNTLNMEQLNGGQCEGLPLQFLDSSRSTRSYKSPMPLSVKVTIGASIANKDSYLYVVGGASKICTQYDTHIDQWTVLTPPALMHIFGSAVTACSTDTMYLCRAASDGSGEDTVDIEIYDFTSNTWSTSRQKMPARIRCFMAAIR